VVERKGEGGNGRREKIPTPLIPPPQRVLTTNVQKHGLGFNIAFCTKPAWGEKEPRDGQPIEEGGSPHGKNKE